MKHDAVESMDAEAAAVAEFDDSIQVMNLPVLLKL